MMTLRQFRESRGWSQQKLAAEMGTSQAAISRAELGTVPEQDFVRKAFKISAGAVTPNSFFPDLFAEPMAEAAE